MAVDAELDTLRRQLAEAEAKLAGRDAEVERQIQLRHATAMDALTNLERAELAEAKLALAGQDARRYRNAIIEHNGNYGECDKKKCGYAPYKYRECPDCPAQHKIDLVPLDGAAAIAAGEGK